VFLASRVALAALAVTLAAASQVQVTVDMEVMQWLLEPEEY
jgi:hypothetical protein